ncbi:MULTISPECIES: cupin domain-containing protein [unclassified Rhizobium]|uniref:cupin domain-containing protein n=1 Tax=unclassified Rhizobium TaxID=2613769 RepID=UPI000A211383|nr:MULTISPECIES: cupin domain-containing protein [unclassified Rhizobium]ARO27005.1 cupin 2 domain-containing protein [Rhizobium sp. TAL182]
MQCLEKTRRALKIIIIVREQTNPCRRRRDDAGFSLCNWPNSEANTLQEDPACIRRKANEGHLNRYGALCSGVSRERVRKQSGRGYAYLKDRSYDCRSAHHRSTEGCRGHRFDYEIAPGATLPIHQHRYQRYGYVLSGEITVTNTESGKESIFTAGDFIVESWGIWHKGANNGTEPVKLLVIDQVEKGSENVLPQK